MSEEIKLTNKLTEEEVKAINEKCEKLAEENKVSKVYACVLFKPDFTRVISYVSEPKFLDKVALMDKAFQYGPYQAANDIRELYLIKEYSDPLTFGETPECDPYKLGLLNFIVANVVQSASGEFKKK